VKVAVSRLFPRMFPMQRKPFPVLSAETFHPKNRKQTQGGPLVERSSGVSCAGNGAQVFPAWETRLFPGVFPDPVARPQGRA